ncbi:MAG TPA: ATP-binding protein [Candidatus Acidoferrales bacterium]|nr:ATP-binding protein [Candidatus Acidoferrales bacterium]
MRLPFAILCVFAPATSHFNMEIGVALALLALIFLVAAGVFIALRRSVLDQRQTPKESAEAFRVNAENPSAFMTASMQGVIQRLREQEQELARLHQLEKERAQETERLSEAVTRNMPAGLLLVNATGTISSANPAAEKALGIRGLQYRRYTEILGADSPLTQMLTACLHDGQTFQRDEVPHVTSAGELRKLGVTISPIYRPVRNPMAAGSTVPPEPKLTGALCLMSDLTELATLQKQMRWKENLAALGEMSAGIAHEFKNALATISGYAQMIHNEAPTVETGECAGKIIEQTRSLTHVVTEFLRFARPLELAQEDFALSSVVDQVVEEVGTALSSVAIRTDGAFAEVSGDAGLLRQALLNLTRNAVEAASSNGHPGEVTISGYEEIHGGKRWQRVAVRDNGPGIAAGNLDKIFVPFFTTKSSGTGLGLAVVQKIALQHGGRVEARNQPGGGAEFDLWLPLR